MLKSENWVSQCSQQPIKGKKIPQTVWKTQKKWCTKNYALNPRHTMKQGWFNKSNHLLFQTTKEFKQMVSLLIHTVKTQSPELAFHAAVSLGRLCVVEPVSKMYLITRLPGLSPRDKGEVRVWPLNFLCIKSNYWITHRNMWIGILKLWNSRM